MRKSTWEDAIEAVNGIDPDNAEYILAEDELKRTFEYLREYEDGGNTSLAEWYSGKIRKFAQEYGERHLTPKTEKVGGGATILLWTDCHACTIVKVTPQTITVRRDKAILDPNFKPEFIPGGFAGTVINQDEQSYTYEPDPNGRLETFHWSRKWLQYGRPGHPSLIKGRHEFYDYNF